MTTYWLDLTISLVGYALMATGYFGWGILCARLLAITFEPLERPFALIWLGWSISLVFFHLWNFLAPVAIHASLIFLAIGFSFAMPNLRSYIKSALSHSAPFDLGYGITLALLSVWIASWSMLTPDINDSGLYHFSSIRWINEYAVVPGLGNVHGRLAFNQSFFTYVASLNLYPLFNQGHNLANSFLFLLLFAELWRHLFTLIHRLPNAVDHRPSMVAVFFIPFLTYHVLFSSIASPTPDNASSVLQILLFIHYANFLKVKAFDKYADARLTLIVVLAATLITLKLTNLCFAAVIFATSLLFRFRGALLPQSHPLGTKIKLLVISCMIVIPWLSRGLIASGYPVYPSTVGRIQTDWSVPVARARNESAGIFYGWARKPNVPPDEVPGNRKWLAGWFDTISRKAFVSVVYPVGISALSMILVLAIFISRSRIGKRDGPVLLTTLLLLPPFAALIFWFFTVPYEVRFAHSLFYIAAIASSIPLIEITAVMQRNKTALIASALFLIVNAGLAYRLLANSGGWKNIFTKGGGLINISRIGYVPIPSAELSEKRTESGLKIYVPVRGTNCWNSPLPCTPYFNPELRLRGTGIQSGFRVAPKRGD